MAGQNSVKRINKMLYYKDLSTDTVYGYDETEPSQLPYIQQSIDNGWKNISNEELDSVRKVAEQKKLDAMTYSELRAAAYPPIVDQLDMQYWDCVNGTVNWETAVAAIKAKYPNPEIIGK